MSGHERTGDGVKRPEDGSQPFELFRRTATGHRLIADFDPETGEVVITVRQSEDPRDGQTIRLSLDDAKALRDALTLVV